MNSTLPYVARVFLYLSFVQKFIYACYIVYNAWKVTERPHLTMRLLEICEDWVVKCIMMICLLPVVFLFD